MRILRPEWEKKISTRAQLDEHIALPLREAICIPSKVFICTILSSPHCPLIVISSYIVGQIISALVLPVKLYAEADTVPPAIFPLVSSPLIFSFTNVHCPASVPCLLYASTNRPFIFPVRGEPLVPLTRILFSTIGVTVYFVSVIDAFV
jgi:hypothetical protein